MNCLRCGHCCKSCMVIIVDDPAKGIVDGNLIFHDGMKQPCKHLQGDKIGEYSCALHDYPWYDETPCFSHGQIEQGNTNCRMGKWILKQEKDKIPENQKTTSIGKQESENEV